jgi:hypothetical protein
MNVLEILFWPIKLVFGLALLILRIAGNSLVPSSGLGFLS